MCVVAEILCHRQGGVAYPETGARRIIHLSKDQNRLVEHACRLNFPVQLFTFAAALTDSAKHADSTVLADHVVNQLHDQHRLAHAGPAE